MNFNSIKSRIGDAYAASKKFLSETYDPRVSRSIVDKQREALHKLLDRFGIQSDGLSQGLKTINDKSRQRDNPILKALQNRLMQEQELASKLKSVKMAQSSPDLKMEEAFSKVNTDTVKIKEKLQDLRKSKANYSPDDYKRFKEELSDKLSDLDLERARLAAAKAKKSIKRGIEAQELNSKLFSTESRMSDIKDNLRFDLDRADDLSDLHGIARDQKKLDTIRNRRLLTGGLAATTALVTLDTLDKGTGE